VHPLVSRSSDVLRPGLSKLRSIRVAMTCGSAACRAEHSGELLIWTAWSTTAKQMTN
jgi:hypothetical protein